MTRHHPSRTTWGGLGALAGGVVLMLTAALVQPALASSVTPTPFTNDEQSCSYWGYDASFKIDRQPTNGDHLVTTPGVDTTGTMPAGLTITISNVVVDTDAKTVTFDWSATVAGESGPVPFLVNAVLVKFADGGLRYHYGATGVSHDEGLMSTKDSISHVDFCWTTPGSTTTTEGGTTTTEGGTTTTGGGTTTTTGGTTTTTEAVTTTSDEATTTTDQVTTTETTEAILPASQEQATPTTVVVGGVQVERLPRTGLAALPLLELGVGLIGLGIVLLALERRGQLTTS